MTNNLIFPFHSFQPIQVSRYHARSLSFRFLIRLMRPLLHFTRIYQSTTSISCMHCTKDVLYWSFNGDGVWHGMERKREWHESNLKKHDDKHFGVCTNSKFPFFQTWSFNPHVCWLATFLELILTFFEKRHQQYRAAIVYGSFVLLVSQWNCKRNDKNEYFVFEFTNVCWVFVCITIEGCAWMRRPKVEGIHNTWKNPMRILE